MKRKQCRLYHDRLRGIRDFLFRKHLPSGLVFILMGIIATVWFLIRVIPKPQRATYPCMKVAAPIMSNFVIWLMTVTTSVFAFKKAGKYFRSTKIIMGMLFLLLAAGAGMISVVMHAKKSYAYQYNHEEDFVPNEPVGVARGIFPGRVVWVWDPDATNENQTGTDDGEIEVSENDDYYFLRKNNDQTVIDTMMSRAVRELTGAPTVAVAWDSLFRYHNRKKYGSSDPYLEGQKIFIKINATSIIQGDGGHDWSTWGPGLVKYKPTWMDRPDIVETTPQVVLAVLNELINEAGVRQEDIYVGDPMKNVYKHLFDMWKEEFPGINVLGNDLLFSGLDLEALGRVPVRIGGEDIFYSDKGHVMKDAVSDHLYKIFEEADYVINIAALKAHARAGVTLCAKNHFGSQTRESAEHLHPGLVADPDDQPVRTNYGMYRVQVDIMGHELLGGNTMLFMVDALYSGMEGWTDAYPVKWSMSPFNNDFTSSIFLSQDGVALESVCFDFLRTEYNGTGGKTDRPNMPGVDDYLLQAADPSQWPDKLDDGTDFSGYDPENDGTVLTSLGAYEHWNNPDDKLYSRNLGTGDGIELIQDLNGNIVHLPERYSSTQVRVYPNPAEDHTLIEISNTWRGKVIINIIDINGHVIATYHERKENETFEFTVPLHALMPGVYFIETECMNRKVTKKIQKL